MFGGGDLRSLFGALQAKIALVLALMQIAQGGNKIGTSKGFPNSVVRRNLGAVGSEGELWIGAKKSGGLRRLHLVDTQSVGLECWIGGFEFGLDLIPSKTLLRVGPRRGERDERDCCRDRE